MPITVMRWRQSKTLLLLCVVAASAAHVATALEAPIGDQHPKIYVADVPPELNANTLTGYNVKKFFTNFGASPNGVWSNPIGDYISEQDNMELHNTYMYGLDVLFHRQLMQSPLRVYCAEDADLIFLPVYVDLGCRMSQEKGGDAAAWRLAVDAFWGTFADRFPNFDKKPHFMVSGRREAENMGFCGIDGTMYGKVEACNFLCHPYARNIFVLTSEIFTGSLDQMSPKPLRPNSLVVPWPGHWHMHLGSAYFQQPFDPEAHKAARRYLAMESLKVRLPLRKLLYKSCMERSSQCLHFNPRGSIAQFNQSEIYNIVKSAWYCIQPPGDGPSRHATMDCLAADTMPVFFDQHLTAVMPFSDLIDFAEFTEYIDPGQLQAQQANAIDVLQAAFSEERALAKAARLHHVKHLFLYSLNPEHTLIRWDEAHTVHPLDDAFTASIKALLRRVCDRGFLGKCDLMSAGRSGVRATTPSAIATGLLKPRSTDSSGTRDDSSSEQELDEDYDSSRSSRSEVVSEASEESYQEEGRGTEESE